MTVIQDNKKPYLQRLKDEIQGLKMEVEKVKVKYDRVKQERDFLKREVLLIEEKDEKNYKDVIDLNVFRSNHPE